jgi:hypothetical protein
MFLAKNNRNGEARRIDVTAEVDEKLFVALVIENEDGDELMDLVIDDDEEIRQFRVELQKALDFIDAQLVTK